MLKRKRERRVAPKLRVSKPSAGPGLTVGSTVTLPPRKGARLSSSLQEAFKKLALIDTAKLAESVRWDLVSEHFAEPFGIVKRKPKKGLVSL